MAYYETDSNGVTWTVSVNNVACFIAIVPQVVFMDTFKLRKTMLLSVGTMGKVIHSVQCLVQITK